MTTRGARVHPHSDQPQPDLPGAWAGQTALLVPEGCQPRSVQGEEERRRRPAGLASVGEIAAATASPHANPARHELLELRAPQDGVVKDFATHTLGSVLQPGTVLMTLVPTNDPMQAEVWVTHDDAGFVGAGQPVKLKLATYPFQKYGMLEGKVKRISPDASDLPGERRAGDAPRASSGDRTLVSLQTSYLAAGANRYPLAPGMQVSAEIHLGTRTVLEYILSPVQRTLHEAGRER